MAKGKKATFSTKEGTKIKTKTGKTFTLLNPEQEGRRFAVELRTGKNVYTGEELSCCQKAWRSGALANRRKAAACYNAQTKKERNDKTRMYSELFNK